MSHLSIIFTMQRCSPPRHSGQQRLSSIADPASPSHAREASASTSAFSPKSSVCLVNSIAKSNQTTDHFLGSITTQHPWMRLNGATVQAVAPGSTATILHGKSISQPNKETIPIQTMQTPPSTTLTSPTVTAQSFAGEGRLPPSCRSVPLPVPTAVVEANSETSTASTVPLTNIGTSVQNSTRTKEQSQSSLASAGDRPEPIRSMSDHRQMQSTNLPYLQPVKHGPTSPSGIHVQDSHISTQGGRVATISLDSVIPQMNWSTHTSKEAAYARVNSISSNIPEQSSSVSLATQAIQPRNVQNDHTSNNMGASHLATLNSNIHDISHRISLEIREWRLREPWLRAACQHGDLLFLHLHQLFCIHDMNSAAVSQLGLGPDCDSGFAVFGVLFGTNTTLPRELLAFLSGWPSSTYSLGLGLNKQLTQWTCDVARFLPFWGSCWPEFRQRCLARRVPPMASEVFDHLRCLSSLMLPRAIFSSIQSSLNPHGSKELHADVFRLFIQNEQKSYCGQPGSAEYGKFQSSYRSNYAKCLESAHLSPLQRRQVEFILHRNSPRCPTTSTQANRLPTRSHPIQRPPAHKPEALKDSLSARSQQLFQCIESYVLDPSPWLSTSGFVTFDFHIPVEILNRRAQLIQDPKWPLDLPTRFIGMDMVSFNLRCAKLDNKADTTDFCSIWTTLPTHWPQHIFVSVNDQHLELKRERHNVDDLPVDVTDFLQSGKNNVKISIHPEDSKKDVDYAIAVEVIGAFDHAKALILLSRISAETSLQLITDAMKKPQGVTSDLILVNDKLTINVTDALSSQLITTPVRGKICKHRECFDLETFLNKRRSKHRDHLSSVYAWRCPICKADARPQSLIIDGFLQAVCTAIIDQGLKENARAIIVNVDGSWQIKMGAVVDQAATKNPSRQKKQSSRPPTESPAVKRLRHNEHDESTGNGADGALNRPSPQQQHTDVIEVLDLE